MKTFREYVTEQSIVNEVNSELGHIVLDITGLGFDLVGGQGAWFDATNAIWYASEKNYLYAALSLISVIPVIGDVVGKGGKYLHKMEKTRKVGASMYKTGKVMKSAKTVDKIGKVKSTLKNPKVKEKISKIFDVAKKNKKFAPHIDQMQTALDDFADTKTMTV